MCMCAFVYVCYMHASTSHVPGASASLKAWDANDTLMLMSPRS